MSRRPGGKSTEPLGSCDGGGGELQPGPPRWPETNTEPVLLVPRDLQCPLEAVGESRRHRGGNHGQPGTRTGVGGQRVQKAEHLLIPGAGATGQEQPDAGTAQLRRAARIPGGVPSGHGLHGERHQRLLVSARGSGMAPGVHKLELALRAGADPFHAALRGPLQEEACAAQPGTGRGEGRGRSLFGLAGLPASPFPPDALVHVDLEAKGPSLQGQEIGRLLLQLRPATLPPGTVLDHLLPLLLQKVQESGVGIGQRSTAGGAGRRSPDLAEKADALPELPGPLPVGKEPGIRLLPLPHPFQRPGLRIAGRLDPVSARGGGGAPSREGLGSGVVGIG
jgi:hypothetical protein